MESNLLQNSNRKVSVKNNNKKEGFHKLMMKHLQITKMMKEFIGTNCEIGQIIIK